MQLKDRNHFESECGDFLAQSRQLGDSWHWIEHQKLPHFGFLCKKGILQPAHVEPCIPEIDISADEIIREEPDAAVLLEESQKPLWMYEYHVVYSEAYAVPVLYFNCSTLDGSPVPLDSILESLHSEHRDQMKRAQWPAISQEDHPTLSVPFFFIHPCRTADLMRAICHPVESGKSTPQTRYLVTWLSLLGPVVGLHVDCRYAQSEANNE